MIVVGGDNLIDLIESTRDTGSVMFAGARGGSGYNTARVVGRQLQKVGFITPISTDNLGDFLADALVSDGIELLSSRSQKPSSMAVVSLKKGQPSYQFYRNDTAEREVDLPLLQKNFPSLGVAFHLTSLAIIDGPDSVAWADFFIAQNKAGIVTTLDPNVRPILIPDRSSYLKRLWLLMSAVDLIKLSDEDLTWIFPEIPFEDACVKLLNKTSAHVTIVTKGKNGVIAFWNNQRIDISAYPVGDLVDTVGAGDTFMGTVLSFLSANGVLSQNALPHLSEEFMQTLLLRAAKAAAINCGRKGCNPPSLKELD